MSKLRFLVVEDQAFQREALVMLLESIGARQVRQAEHGRAALELIETGWPPSDIILCDIDMPEMDGMTFLRLLSDAHCRASIILISGVDRAMLNSVEAMAKAYGLELLGTMPKPPSRSTLLSLIAAHRHDSTQQRPGGSDPIPGHEIAAALKNGEFVPYFQPKVSLASGKVVGVEALVRWNHPTRGLLAPGVFLHLVETGGFMDSLTWIILAKSAAICKRWHEQGLPLKVSVNLSLSSLARIELAERIFEVVTQQGLAPEAMILEVTETAAMSDVGQCIENLVRLRLRGFGLSIDDYGTGYSSMQQLTRVPFTELKIDQSFVKIAGQHESGSVVVESAIDIARKLGLKSTAEGVETIEQWDMLRKMGCDIAQGYWLSRPMAEAAVADWVADWGASFKQPVPVAQAIVNILLVEDEDFQRETYGDMLVQLGLGLVHTARDVAAALQRLAESSYDLIITDVQLGGPTGLDLAHLIRTRQTPASPAMRIIVLTAHEGDRSMVVGAIRLDINGLLTKPVNARTLLETIQHAMKEAYTPRPAAAYLETPGDITHPPHRSAAIMRPEAKKRQKMGRPVDGALVPLAALKAGMVLAESVHASDMTLVLGKGHKLTPSIINRLMDIHDILASSDVWVAQRMEKASPPP